MTNKIKKDHRGLCLVSGNNHGKQTELMSESESRRKYVVDERNDYLGDRASDADDTQASFDLVKELQKSVEFAAETVRLSKLGK